MKLSTEEIVDIMAQASNRLHMEIKLAYKAGRLREYLEKIGMEELMPEEPVTSWEGALPNGKIIVFGESAIKEREILASLKSAEISKERIELHLGYEELKHYEFSKLQYNANYRLILVGPMPHSNTDKGDFSSAITMMENSEGFTKIKRLNNQGSLKITKTNLKIAVEEEIGKGYLAAG